MAQKKVSGKLALGEKTIASRKFKFGIVRPAVLIKTFSSRSGMFIKLQQLHVAAAVLYAAQAIVLLVVGHAGRVPVVLNYLGPDPIQTAVQQKTVLTLATHHWFDMELRMLLVVVLLLAAALHAALATVLRSRYEASLAKKMHDVRWFSYGVAGGLLLVVVALVIGVADAAILLALFGLGVIMGLGALAIEANRRLWPWSLFGGVAAATMVLIVKMYVLGGIVYGAALPAYAYVALGVLGVGIVAVAANLWLQISDWRWWREYTFAEVMYIGIDLVVVSALAWTVFAGALH